MTTTTRIGLISDTHMPDRWRQLPPRIFDLFSDVDMIIHAGDVGELWVLDQLSTCAPVIAVHGNDETDEAQAALPYLHTLSAAGYRIVVTHAHYPDRAEELASRTEDWQPKFDHRANFAKQHGATICIFGHLHIPMLLHHDDILLINPGAIASGNPWTKQRIQTIAILTLESDQQPQVTHYDLAAGQVHEPYFNPKGFSATSERYQDLIFEADFMPHREYIWQEIRPLDARGHKTLLSACHEVWSDERDIISTETIVQRFLALNNENISQKLRSHPYFGTYMTSK